MTINGLPLHPLVVHAAVVFAPMAALCAIAYHWPSWRDKLRWPMAILSVIAAVLVWFSAFTGSNLENSATLRSEMAVASIASAVHHHEDLAGKLQASTWVLAALSVIAWWLHNRPGVLRTILSFLLPITAVAALVLVYLTGEAGAKAVWAGFHP